MPGAGQNRSRRSDLSGHRAAARVQGVVILEAIIDERGLV